MLFRATKFWGFLSPSTRKLLQAPRGSSKRGGMSTVLEATEGLLVPTTVGQASWGPGSVPSGLSKVRTGQAPCSGRPLQ